ncbi:bifunctional nicotinamidase/pyrazinamidase [bacterium]|nr:bifunctional nicotinamidase/pyrazinamidase [bacterium]
MKTLLLIDIQNDFVPGGALAVTHGDEVVPVANSVMRSFDLVVATQDWHPADHGSFASNHPGKKPGDVIDLNGLGQILWPDHCVRNTHGAEFVSGLDTGRIVKVFRKGTDSSIDSYSGFYDNGYRKSTGLGDYLKERGVEDVFVMGLATDYCVRFSALDAVKFGFRTFLIVDGCRGVELAPGDTDRAIAEMKRAGITVIESPMLDES